MNKINQFKIRARQLSIIPFYVVFSFFVFSSCSTDEKQTVATFNNLVMSDEFDVNGKPNSEIWNYNIGTGNNGWGNGELQYYTDRTENVTVQNGVLLITARKESFNGSFYTSARLLTKGKFEQAYGRYEARIRVPYGQGIWPAFWLLGANSDTVVWPQCGEIDILEYRGQNPTTILGTVSKFQDQNTPVEVILTSVTDIKNAPVQPGANGTHLRTIHAIPAIEFTEELRRQYYDKEGITAYSSFVSGTGRVEPK